MANYRHIAPFLLANPFHATPHQMSGLDADYMQIVPFIRNVEGGLSKAKTDSASKDPVPDGSGYHTNKGITWATLKSWQQKLGIKTIAELIKVFYEMPDHVWLKIYKSGYWDPIKGDQIKSQAFADMLVDWAYTSGPGTAIKKTQEFFKLPVTRVMDAKTLQTINSISNEQALIDSFSRFKKNWYLSLPGQQANYKGWANRLDKLYTTVKTKVVATVQQNSGIITTGLVAITTVIVLYAVFKKTKPQPIQSKQ